MGLSVNGCYVLLIITFSAVKIRSNAYWVQTGLSYRPHIKNESRKTNMKQVRQSWVLLTEITAADCCSHWHEHEHIISLLPFTFLSLLICFSAALMCFSVHTKYFPSEWSENDRVWWAFYSKVWGCSGWGMGYIVLTRNYITSGNWSVIYTPFQE